LVSGLLVSSKSGFHLKLENLKPIEEFEELGLLKKYGFDLGLYTFGQNVHVVLKQTNTGENEIYLAENKIEVEPIINKLANEVVEDFGVTEEDQKDMFDLLRKHGCCYF
jgi:DNA-binding Lrp family transcriptional regulator